MLTCERCGAAILPSSEQCAYCGTVSEQARVVLQAERARQQQLTDQLVAQQAVLRQQVFGVTEQAASRALLFGRRARRARKTALGDALLQARRAVVRGGA